RRTPGGGHELLGCAIFGRGSDEHASLINQAGVRCSRRRSVASGVLRSLRVVRRQPNPSHHPPLVTSHTLSTTIRTSPQNLIVSPSTRNRSNSKKSGRSGSTPLSTSIRKSCSTHDFLRIAVPSPQRHSYASSKRNTASETRSSSSTAWAT